jgi:3-methyladenine DNA glycosylase AlkD
MKTTASAVLAAVRSQANPRNVEGMARYGITSAKAFGVPAPVIHRIAKGIGRDHDLALKLWSTGILEARAIAGLVGDPAKVTKKLMNTWVKDFDNWAVCDGTCGNLFDKTPLAYEMAPVWARRKEEFVKRAGFVLMASLAVHDKKAPDKQFLKFLPIIKREANDPRNFVRKAVNWALRQIGKRNPFLNEAARRTGKELRTRTSSAARWIASDALRELESVSVQKRLLKKKERIRTDRRHR